MATVTFKIDRAGVICINLLEYLFHVTSSDRVVEFPENLPELISGDVAISCLQGNIKDKPLLLLTQRIKGEDCVRVCVYGLPPKSKGHSRVGPGYSLLAINIVE